MAQKTLVAPEIQVGTEVVEDLEAAGIKPAIAMYMNTEEDGGWRFAIASPSLDQNSKLKAYKQVLDALRDRSYYTQPDVVVFDMKDPIVRDLRKRFASAGDVTGMRLGGQLFGDRVIEDAYVYRIH